MRLAYRPSAVRRDLETLRAHRAELEHAIACARGLGTRFALEWRAGPRAGIALLLPPGDAGSAFARAVRRAYPPGAWERAFDDGFPEGRADPGSRRFVRLGTGALLPLLPDDHARPWTAGLAWTLPPTAADGRVVWRFSPGEGGPPAGPRPPPVEGGLLPMGARLAPLTRGERSLRDRLDDRERGPLWTAEGIAEAVTGSPADWPGAAVASIRARSRGTAGGGLESCRPIPILRPGPPVLWLTETEVAAFLPEPDDASPAPRPIDGTVPGIPLGRDESGALVRLPVPEREGRHLVLLGETGMGKSTALVQLALGAARRGGVVLFDPVGDTVDALVERVPAALSDRIVRIAAHRWPVPMNALAALAPAAGPTRERSLRDLVLALRRVRSTRFPESAFWGPRLEEVLTRAVGVAAELPGGTLVDAERILSGEAVPPRSQLPGAAGDRLSALRRSLEERPDDAEGARRLLAEVTRSEPLRTTLCTPGAPPPVRWLDRADRIVVISGDAADVGETAAQYVLSVLLALLWSAIASRTGAAKRFIVLDEAQWYANDVVAELLRLGRRTNAHLWLATQALDSLPDPVADAARTNAADFLLFRGSPVDAREFARFRPDLDPAGILALERGTLLALLGKGRTVIRIRLPSPLPRPARGGVDRRPAGDAPAGPSTDASATPAARGIEPRLLERLGAALLLDPHADPVAVPLGDLRAADPAGGGSVRSLGTVLHAEGVLVGRQPGSAGPEWRLRREPLRRFLESARTGRPAPGRPESAPLRGVPLSDNQ